MEQHSHVPPQLVPYAFKPGQSGNPSGRPKNTLKDFMRHHFMDMSDEEKAAFLKDIPKEIRWRMAEGNPSQEQEIKGELIINVINYGDSNSSQLPPRGE